MFDSGAWQCKNCETVLGWVADSRLTMWACRGQPTTIDSGDVKCHVCGEMQRFCPTDTSMKEADAMIKLPKLDKLIEVYGAISKHWDDFWYPWLILRCRVEDFYALDEVAAAKALLEAITELAKQPPAQQAVSEMLNEDGYVDTLHLGC